MTSNAAASAERVASAGPAELLDLDEVQIDPSWAFRIPPALATRRQLLPFVCVDSGVHVACLSTADAETVEPLKRFIEAPLVLEPAEPESLRRALRRVYGGGAASAEQRPLLGVSDTTTSALRGGGEPTTISDELLFAAEVRDASDIHIDPGPDGISVRLRVDGILEPYRSLPVDLLAGLISRFKVLAGMDISERRAPQDGGFSHRATGGTRVDVRVATLPTKHGERMALRLLPMRPEALALDRLGMSRDNLAVFEEQLAVPHGMILLTGPTGSGKSTTLYASLRRVLAARRGNIITVEDPIEYDMPGIAQVEVDATDRVSFQKALRSLLRHDPDVIMIGEIRDQETADVAIKAALTGHLVFSTLHTSSAAGVITRLQDMGVERYLIAATLRLAVSQRLVRQLCHRCRHPRPLTAREAAALCLPAPAGRLAYEGRGCKYCGNRGVAGRVGLFELLPIGDQVARRIATGCGELELVDLARELGLERLLDDGVRKVLDGRTAVGDVLAAVTT